MILTERLVLNVDDHEPARYARRRILEAAGFAVCEAANGEEALHLLEERLPAVVLLDINLPDIDGYEVCRRIKSSAAAAGVAVLQISATYADDHARVSALDSGADAYLNEPVAPDVLVATTNALLRARQAEQALRTSNRRLALLAETASALLSHENPKQFISELFARVAGDLGLELFFNFLAEEDSRRLRLHCCGGVPDDVAKRLEWLEFGEAVCGTVALTRRHLVFEDVQHTSEPLLNEVRSLEVTAYACFPLIAKGRLVGTCSFGSRRRTRLESDELELLQALANHVAVALDRYSLHTQLQTHTERLSAIMDNTEAVVYIVDARGEIVLVNRRFENLFGIPGRTLRGLSIQEVFSPETAAAFAANNRLVLESGKPAEFEETVPQPGGAHTYLSIKVPLFDERGEPRAVCGISTDITARKAAEQRLLEYDRRMRRLVESNIIGVLVADMERISDANDLFLEMVGYTHEDLRAGKLVWSQMTPPEFAGVDARGIEELRQRGACTPFEKEYYRKDGTRVPVLIGAALLSDAPEWLCFVLDLSERKRAEQAIREAQKLESLGFLAGGMAHNLNNLLVGILGNISLVLDGLPGGASAEREMLESAIQSAQRAATLTSQLLAYAGKGQFCLQAVDPARLLRTDLMPLLRGSVPQATALELHVSPGLPQVGLDVAQARQLISNLVTNAAEAIGDRPGTISIRAGVEHVEPEDATDMLVGGRLDPGPYLVLTVADTGEGIDAATKARMFDPFFSTRFTGRGLGLAAVAGIVRAYKGGIRVLSSPGKGSVFQVYLPAKSAAGSAALPAGAEPERHDAALVLVIDDEAIVLRMAKVALERRGFRVLVAESARRGMELLRQHAGEVGLVLLDLTMPGIGGEQALEAYRRIHSGVPIAICSAHSRDEMAARFQGKAVAGFIQKPFTAAALVAEVAALVKPGIAGTS